MLHYIADDGCNSNIYVAGLLISAGVVPAPIPPVFAAGFQCLEFGGDLNLTSQYQTQFKKLKQACLSKIFV